MGGFNSLRRAQVTNGAFIVSHRVIYDKVHLSGSVIDGVYDELEVQGFYGYTKLTNKTSSGKVEEVFFSSASTHRCICDENKLIP